MTHILLEIDHSSQFSGARDHHVQSSIYNTDTQYIFLYTLLYAFQDVSVKLFLSTIYSLRGNKNISNDVIPSNLYTTSLHNMYMVLQSMHTHFNEVLQQNVTLIPYISQKLHIQYLQSRNTNHDEIDYRMVRSYCIRWIYYYK